LVSPTTWFGVLAYHFNNGEFLFEHFARTDLLFIY